MSVSGGTSAPQATTQAGGWLGGRTTFGRYFMEHSSAANRLVSP